MFERYAEKARRTIFFRRYEACQFGSPVALGTWESAMKSLLCACSLVLAITVLATALAPSGPTQKSGKYKTLTNDQVREMLNRIEEDIKERYYDPTFHGLDLDARFESARKKIAAAQSQNEALLDVAGAVASLNDSHTRFLPPPAPYGVEYGRRMQAIGILIAM